VARTDADGRLLAMARPAAADDFAFKHLERCTNPCDTVALVVVGHSRALAALEWQAGLGCGRAPGIWLFSSMDSTAAWRGGLTPVRAASLLRGGRDEEGWQRGGKIAQQK
jgi:hypothetical protein